MGRKIIIASISIFWLVVLVVLSNGLISKATIVSNATVNNSNSQSVSQSAEGKNSSQLASQSGTTTSALREVLGSPATAPSPTPVSTSAPTPSGYTASQVTTHNSRTSCWMIISGNVYDVTSYLPYHPGGINAILAYCGSDATAAFTDIHSGRAMANLDTYYIGPLINN